MAKVFDEIDDHLRGWIARQALFFVATAPAGADGHVNVSPKGPIGSFAVLGPRRVAYLDAHGSGSETIAHLRENGRICVMFCSFEGPPRILRLHGRGEAVIAGDPRFDELFEAGAFDDPSIPEARRSIVVVDVERVGDSCGYGVPLMSFEGLRDHHALSSAKRLRTMGADGYLRHQRERGARSLDGLPAQEP
ncbi:MAG: pyridoxamine 5'-phosphate oxidase family protein [Solirubrobacterales bacterium]